MLDMQVAANGTGVFIRCLFVADGGPSEGYAGCGLPYSKASLAFKGRWAKEKPRRGAFECIAMSGCDQGDKRVS
ncbi:MAG TPA: hypothetical protein VFL47_01825 [Flavisolibacter sp.]|nr:hypothetical protein [Flavisolibacter sp.]